MSVTTTTTTLDYTGDGVTTDFVIPFPYLDKSHVYVKVGADVDNLGEQAQGTAFTIDLDGPQDANDGTISMTVAPTTGYVVRVYRIVPLTQPTDLRAQGNFSAATHENALDKLTMIAQQLNAGALVAETIVTGAQLDSATTPTAVTAATGTPGVSASASPADHRHQVTTAAASSLTPDAANAAGVSNSLARADHHHLLTTYSSTPAAIGTASAGTSGTAPARGNHVHAHGDQPAGDLMHAIATTTVNGFMSAEDKVRVDEVAWTYDTQITTTDATVTTAHTIPVTSNYSAIVEVEAFALDGGGTFGVIHKCAGIFKNAAGTVSQYGPTQSMASLFGSTTAGSFSLSGANVLYRVTGVAATTIKWRVRARIIERSY